LRTVVILVGLLSASGFATGWPIPPLDSVHPLGNNWGNYQDYGGSPYFHNGIDIITVGQHNAEVRAVRRGWVKAWGTIQADLHYRLAVCDTNLSYTGRAEGWLYAHIDSSRWHKQLGDEVQAGELIGYLVYWTVSGFDHIHFARISDTGATWQRFPNPTWWFIQNPLTILRPNTDLVAPVFQNARTGARFAFCRDNVNNSYLNPTGLTGDVDIIARIYDKTGYTTRNDTWDKLAPYQIEHMIRRDDGLVVRPWTLSLQFSNRLDAANVHVVYKNDNTCNSYGDYSRREYYYIVTNTDGDSIIESTDTQGKWATAEVGDGNYWVIVRASDVYGNSTLDSMLVTTANGVGLAELPAAALDGRFTLTPTAGRGPRTIAFNLLAAGRVQLRAFDQTGRLATPLCDAVLPAGPHSFRFDPPAPGLYFVELVVPGVLRQTAKVTALR